MSYSAPERQRRRRVMAVAAAAAAATAAAPTGRAQVQVAETLLINVDATGLTPGMTSSVPNNGTLGGVFEARGGGDTTPFIGTPLLTSSAGTRGIRLDGNDFLQHAQAVGGPLVPAPGGLVGTNPTRSIEAWVWNPAIADEETMVAWGRRGGTPDGSNMSFNYGANPSYGAVGHWGAGPDIGWAGAPAARQWHHLVYTFDGTTTRVYADGAFKNSEVSGNLNTHTAPGPLPISLGTQLNAQGQPNGALRGSLTLGRVRVHDGVLTDQQILDNYNFERGSFTEPTNPPPAPLARGPVHRFSFSNPAGDAAAGAQITDSIGNAHGTVQGTGATWSGTRLLLPGGPSGSAPYGDMQNGLLSKFGAARGGPGQVSVEGWVRHTESRNWSRFFDFGATTAGELQGPGGTGTGVDYLMLSAQNAGNVDVHRFELFDTDTNPAANRTVDVGSTTFGNDLHFVVTWNETTGELKLYEQGFEAASVTSPGLISNINDLNNWLGRSNYTGDVNFQGEFDEFRLYDRVLTPEEVLGNFQAGPDVVTPEPSALAAALAAAAGALLRRRGRR